MRHRVTSIVVLALLLSALAFISAAARGPANAGDGVAFTRPNWASYLYIGVDYGVGWTATTTADGTVIDPIGSPAEPATLLAKGHYFSEWWEPYSEKDWVYYKFWLKSPVKITFPNGDEVFATRFIAIECQMATGEYTLKSYR